MALCTIALWVRSYFYLDSVKSYSPDEKRFIYVVLLRGGLQIAKSRGYENRLGNGFESSHLSRFMGGAPGDEWQILTGWGTLSRKSMIGFRWARGDLHYQSADLPPAPFWSVRIPLYLLLALFLTLPAWWLWRFLAARQRANRIKVNRCEQCGYDLRGTPARCPECGRQAPTATPAVG
jgi:hypothetical protein